MMGRNGSTNPITSRFKNDRNMTEICRDVRALVEAALNEIMWLVLKKLVW